MTKTLAKRGLLLIATLLLVTILAFVAFSIIPGDPTSSILGVEATAEQIAALRSKLGLDLPIWQRYLQWLGGLLTGDLGESYNYAMPVGELLSTCVTHTLTLAGLAFVLIVVLAIPLGILSARHEGGVVDRVLTILNQITMSVPNFVAGILLVYVFGLVLRLFRPGAIVTPQNGWGPYLWYMLFPALAVALPRAAMTVKMLRGSILSELGQDYIRTAYSKGNSKSSALWRHVLRNAMIPVVTFLAMTVADIMAGSIVVEQVFGIPGLGKMLVTSIGNRDYPVVQAIVVLIATVVVVCNFAADLLYRVMDPRLRGR
ncbi:MAG TPA: ABC transporter permease [Candidatus Enterenecus avicola]|nr:ABC transporter permease [Candidatus Enterenecus avicola]